MHSDAYLKPTQMRNQYVFVIHMQKEEGVFITTYCPERNPIRQNLIKHSASLMYDSV